jgi:hypothetical protein
MLAVCAASAPPVRRLNKDWLDLCIRRGSPIGVSRYSRVLPERTVHSRPLVKQVRKLATPDWLSRGIKALRAAPAGELGLCTHRSDRLRFCGPQRANFLTASSPTILFRVRLSFYGPGTHGICPETAPGGRTQDRHSGTAVRLVNDRDSVERTSATGLDQSSMRPNS